MSSANETFKLSLMAQKKADAKWLKELKKEYENLNQIQKLQFLVKNI